MRLYTVDKNHKLWCIIGGTFNILNGYDRWKNTHTKEEEEEKRMKIGEEGRKQETLIRWFNFSFFFLDNCKICSK